MNGEGKDRHDFDPDGLGRMLTVSAALKGVYPVSATSAAPSIQYGMDSHSYPAMPSMRLLGLGADAR